jgi:hypothetical protein
MQDLKKRKTVLLTRFLPKQKKEIRKEHEKKDD